MRTFTSKEYEDKRIASTRASETKLELETAIQEAYILLRSGEAGLTENYYNYLALKMLDYAHATYDPRQMGRFLSQIAEINLTLVTLAKSD